MSSGKTEEISPDLKKEYLKLIGEAMSTAGNMKPMLRKDVWHYLMSKYQSSLDYRDFLVALRDLQRDGKIENNEGYLNIAKPVWEEIKLKTPTPIFPPKFSARPGLLAQLTEQKRLNEIKAGTANSSSGNSSEGKKQKVKQVESSKQQVVEKPGKGIWAKVERTKDQK